MSLPITIVTMIWPGIRRYTLAHAEAVAGAVARHASFAYRFVVITDAHAHASSTMEIVPFPPEVQRLTGWETGAASPRNLPKLWLFSAEAQELGPYIFYLDADSIITGDLAPIVQYCPEVPFLAMRFHEKLCSAMFRLRTGMLTHIWATFCLRVPTADDALQTKRTDQGWLREFGMQTQYPSWPSHDLGIYFIKELEDQTGWPSRLPADARIVHPTGKVKPGTQTFFRRHPWAQEHYPCLTLR